ncbi:MAG TPA: type IV secretory system conjugative DNA transfer family protein, partial [Flavipsychrobacter sp.]|nr:type IV secretory system conjugative DNA transfer family protein [Flavipsychrobacter sp.]
HSHTAVFGQTSSGKSSTVMVGSCISLARGKSSVVINDVFGELYDITSGMFLREGYEVYKYNFRDPEHSECFNSLPYCQSDSDLNMQSTLIHENSQTLSKGEVFWRQTSIMLLFLILKYLYHHVDRKYLTLQNALRIADRLAYDIPALDLLFVRTRDKELISQYRAAVAMSEKTLQSVVISLRTVLSLWNDKAICSTTATNTFDITQLRSKPICIYLTTPISDLNYTRPATALFFSTLFNQILSTPVQPSDRSIFFLLDEFPTYSFPDICTVFSTIRKRNAGLVICMQDERALSARYGADTAHQIKTNCVSQVYLKGQPLSTCRELSAILGRFSLEGKTRELLTPDEIRQLDEAIILIRNSPPMKAKMIPYFENYWMQRLLKAPPAPIPNRKPVIPALISFEK